MQTSRRFLLKSFQKRYYPCRYDGPDDTDLTTTRYNELKNKYAKQELDLCKSRTLLTKIFSKIELTEQDKEDIKNEVFLHKKT